MPELDEPIDLCAYNPQWPTLFEVEARRIREAVSAEIAIEHIGGTAVPGLLAKPIIDLMLGPDPLSNFFGVRSELVALGYEDMGEAGVPGRIYLRRRASANFNIALVSLGGAIWTANLALRDYLRTHPAAVREYAEAKRRAVDSGIRSLLAYSDHKSPVVARLVSQALAGK